MMKTVEWRKTTSNNNRLIHISRTLSRLLPATPSRILHSSQLSSYAMINFQHLPDWKWNAPTTTGCDVLWNTFFLPCCLPRSIFRFSLCEMNFFSSSLSVTSRWEMEAKNKNERQKRKRGRKKSWKRKTFPEHMRWWIAWLKRLKFPPVMSRYKLRNVSCSLVPNWMLFVNRNSSDHSRH